MMVNLSLSKKTACHSIYPHVFFHVGGVQDRIVNKLIYLHFYFKANHELKENEWN